MSFPFRPENIPPGTRIGGYTTGAKLGMGGAGVVYEARSPDGHRFALKVARQWRAVLDTPPSVDELRLERSNICHGLLNGHPNVVQQYAYERYPDTFSGWPYQVLELVPGSRSITGWARQTNPSLDELVPVFIQLAKLLGDMHFLGIRHRDIKPPNILMTPAGEPKLLDFGSASCDRTLPVTRNAVWAQPGTHGYLPPELCRELIVEQQTRRSRPFVYQPSADLHSLGIVLYKVLTGHHPFDLSLEGERLLWHVASYEPVPLREINPAVPDGLDGIVTMLLRKDPLTRHESGYQLARELELEWLAATESWWAPFSVPVGESTDGYASRTPTPVITEPARSPIVPPVAPTALVRIERWPSPMRTAAPPRRTGPRGRRLAGCLAAVLLSLVIIVIWRMMWPAGSPTQKGADVSHSSPVLTSSTMLTALVCALTGGCARVQVREADRDWLAQCSDKARESVRFLNLPRGHDDQALLLEGENVRRFPERGVEVSAGRIRASPAIGLKQPALLHGVAQIGDDGVSIHFTKLTIGDEVGNAGEGPWPAGKEFEICAIAFDDGMHGTVGPGLPLIMTTLIPAAERRPGSAAIRSRIISIRVAR